MMMMSGMMESMNNSAPEAPVVDDAPEVDGQVYIKGKKLKVGGIYNLQITGSSDYDLFVNLK